MVNTSGPQAIHDQAGGTSKKRILVPVLLVAATILVVVGAGVWRAVTRPASILNPSGGLTSQSLANRVSADVDHPVFLPTELPSGYANNPHESFLVSGFPATDNRGLSWFTKYTVDSLPPTEGNVEGFDVYQVLQGDRRTPRRCGGNQQEAVRDLGEVWITVCLGIHPGPAAVEYWNTVPFSSDVREISWVPDRGTE